MTNKNDDGLLPYYDTKTREQDIGGDIYRKSLHGRRGFRPDQIGIDESDEIWLDIFQDIGEKALKNTRTQQEAVDVDLMKIDDNPYDPEKEILHWAGYDNFERGWNNCLDHLAAQGYLKPYSRCQENGQPQEDVQKALNWVNKEIKIYQEIIKDFEDKGMMGSNNYNKISLKLNTHKTIRKALEVRNDK